MALALYQAQSIPGGRVGCPARSASPVAGPFTGRRPERPTVSDHLPARRASLVDAVLNLPEVQDCARLEAVFPLGDSESLHRLKERCKDVSTHPAGASALAEANLPSGSAHSTAQGPAGQAPSQ